MLLDQAQRFVEQVYLPDLLAVASYYKDWAAIGGGLLQLLGLRRPAHQWLRRSGEVQVSARGHSQPRFDQGA